MKRLIYLLVNVILWFGLYQWLFIGNQNIGNFVMFFYGLVIFLMALSVILTFGAIFLGHEPDKIGPRSQFWRLVKFTNNLLQVGVLVWFGHVFLAMSYLCVYLFFLLVGAAYYGILQDKN